MSLYPLESTLSLFNSKKCPHCGGSSQKFVRYGAFFRRSDSKKIQRFKCQHCKKSFSEASFDLCRHQRKRTINSQVFKMLVSGVSQRRCAWILGVNRKTIVRKFLFLGPYALQSIHLQNLDFPKSKIIEFDDLETFEHTKCKPLSVTLAVEQESRRILGFEVSRSPAKGHLAKISRVKYGPRKDERPMARKLLFSKIKHFIEAGATIKSDDHPHYKPDVKKHFPKSRHVTYLSRRACVTGQGELKKVGFDPLFSINHTFAKLRADINRLFRRTWCTTKKPDRLRLHIAMMALHHNNTL